TQFNTVWLPLQGRFYRMAYYMLENEADAKDAVQDLYLKLWNLTENLEIVREPSSYGALMLKNLCIDYIRRRRPSEALLENMAVNDPPDRELDLKDDLQTLAKAIEQLPPGQQRLIRLRFIRGLSYEEIEQETGLSGLNIRVQVSLARKKLKQLL
ncbi:MAG: sigma-70 family RNA polymerase sigma factor, partial [Bacteroidaceae bacterium]|nr:sigma-70 family RNA polymerase sigma factor [Bacteroidaceae bacterium]